MSAGIGVKVDASAARRKLRRLFDAIDDGATRVLENAGAAVEKAARATRLFNDGPRDGKHANLRDSIEHKSGFRDHEMRIWAKAPHGVFVHNGTRAHPITARRFPYLTFCWAGGWARKKTVNHPGTKARPFLKEAADLVRPIFLSNIERTTNAAIQRHNR